MLKYREDWRTVLYMLFTTALPLLQWRLDHFNVVLFITALVMAFALGAVHHNQLFFNVGYHTGIIAMEMCIGAAYRKCMN
jgi:hypothetical protein